MMAIENERNNRALALSLSLSFSCFLAVGWFVCLLGCSVIGGMATYVVDHCFVLNKLY